MVSRAGVSASGLNQPPKYRNAPATARITVPIPANLGRALRPVRGAGWFPADLKKVEEAQLRILDDPSLAKRLKLLWLGVGTEDSSAAFPNTPHLLAMLRLVFEMFDSEDAAVLSFSSGAAVY